MKTLLDRLKAYALRVEWAWNDMDGTGPRCLHCRNQQTEGHKKDGFDHVECELGELCDDIRLVARARELEPPV